MSINIKARQSQLRNSALNTFFSWINHIAVDSIKRSYKEQTEVEKLLSNIEKYYSKRKRNIFSKGDESLLSKKLNELQIAYEDLLCIEEDKHLLKKDRTVDVRTIEYSPMLLSIVVLDHMLHEEKDIVIRRRFGHHPISEMLCVVEEEAKSLSHSTYRIFNEIVKVLEK